MSSFFEKFFTGNPTDPYEYETRGFGTAPVITTTPGLTYTLSLDDLNSVLRSTHAEKYEVDRIYVSEDGNTTAVRWTDGTVTVVKRNPNDKPSLYMAFCAALAKKMYGSSFRVANMIETHTDDYLRKKAQEEKEARRITQAEKEKKEHERKLKAVQKQREILLEALNLLSEKEK